VFKALKLTNRSAISAVKLQEVVRFGPAILRANFTRWKLSVLESSESLTIMGLLVMHSPGTDPGALEGVGISVAVGLKVGFTLGSIDGITSASSDGSGVPPISNSMEVNGAEGVNNKSSSSSEGVITGVGVTISISGDSDGSGEMNTPSEDSCVRPVKDSSGDVKTFTVAVGSISSSSIVGEASISFSLPGRGVGEAGSRPERAESTPVDASGLLSSGSCPSASGVGSPLSAEPVGSGRKDGSTTEAVAVEDGIIIPELTDGRGVAEPKLILMESSPDAVGLPEIVPSAVGNSEGPDDGRAVPNTGVLEEPGTTIPSVGDGDMLPKLEVGRGVADPKSIITASVPPEAGGFVGP